MQNFTVGSEETIMNIGMNGYTMQQCTKYLGVLLDYKMNMYKQYDTAMKERERCSHGLYQQKYSIVSGSRGVVCIVHWSDNIKNMSKSRREQPRR